MSSEKVTNKIVKSNKNTWIIHETCYYKILNYDNDKPLITFDYDDTLCSKFTSNLLTNVEKVILQLCKQYNICIFTNQMGISKNKTTHNEIQERFDKFIKIIEDACFRLNQILNIQIFYSTHDDIYRKPMLGMYELMKKILNPSNVEYYCGDAAGRKGDFSCSDLYFANNCNVKFKTPEEIFHNSQKNNNLCSKDLKSLLLYSDDKWYNGIQNNDRNIIEFEDVNVLDNTNIFESQKKTLLLLIGSQGSGKSTLSKYIAKTYNFEIINGDTYKTKNKMLTTFKKYQDINNKGIIIDNTSPTLKSRLSWIDLLTEREKWHIVYIFINIDKLISVHLTKYRQCFTGVKIPSVAIHSFYKNLEIPTQEECDKLIIINKPIINYKFNNKLRFS